MERGIDLDAALNAHVQAWSGENLTRPVPTCSNARSNGPASTACMILDIFEVYVSHLGGLSEDQFDMEA